METLWLEGFDDLPYDVLEAAFKKALKVCKFWPVKVADIREHVERTKKTASGEAAERAWQYVLDLRRRFWNPDMPGGFSRGMPKLSDRIAQAARAAGVFRDFDSVEGLHVWAKKRFVESYLAWGELEQDRFLLPDGELKNLLAGVAQTRALPGSGETYQEMRDRGLRYAQDLKTSPAEDPNIKRAIRAVAGELVPRPPGRSIEEQKRILREKGFLPELNIPNSPLPRTGVEGAQR